MLTVLSVAFPFAALNADPAGGSEQVLAMLDRALVAARHRSIVIACDGSEVAGALHTVPVAADPADEAQKAVVHAAVRERIAAIVAGEAPDVIHFHGIDFAAYLPPPGPPALVTLHLPLAWYGEQALRPSRPRTILQPVSADQAARAPAGLHLAAPIANGVDTDWYRPGAKADYALVLGRVAPEKGFVDAIEAARLAGVPLRAAGKLYPYPAHRHYFEAEVLPRLDAERTWVGEAQGEAKRRLLAEARCLLVPATAPETSSLVAMEALASGTPVIAYRAGALPSLIEHGRTGFLVDTVAEMAAAIHRTDEIDPAWCRAAACERFPASRTIAAYLDLYRSLAT